MRKDKKPSQSLRDSLLPFRLLLNYSHLEILHTFNTAQKLFLNSSGLIVIDTARGHREEELKCNNLEVNGSRRNYLIMFNAHRGE